MDHTSSDLSQIPDEWISRVKVDRQIAYKHTSHGGQLVSGMTGLKNSPAFNSKYDWTDNSQENSTTLSFDDSELDRLTTGNNLDGYSGIGSCAHLPEFGETSDARLNCTLKGRAVWYLFARLAGWDWDPDNAGGSNNITAMVGINTFLLQET